MVRPSPSPPTAQTAPPADREQPRSTGRASSRLSGLDAGGGDDEVGREAEQDPGDEEPGDEHRMAVLAVDREELPHHVEDRTAGNGEEGDRDRVARPCLPQDRAEEGGSTSDQAQEAEQPPARDDP